MKDITKTVFAYFSIKFFKNYLNFVAKNFQNSHSSFKVATTFQVATTSSDSSKIFAQVYKNKNWLVV